MEHDTNNDIYCVYYHKNKINDKYYIGITKNAKKRWGKNGKQYKGCTYFWNAIQKYGWDNFEHVILLSDLTKEQAKIIEVYLIAKFNLRDSKYGYNIGKGGDFGPGLEGKTHPNSKPVFQYSLDGDFIREWESESMAAKVLHINHVHIHRAAKGEMKQSHGYQWSFIKYDKMPSCVDARRIYKINFDGELVKVYNIHELDDYSQAERDRIRQCCYGHTLSTCGFFWLFEQDYSEEKVQQLIKRKFFGRYDSMKKICVYDLSGKLIQTFPNIFEASDFTGVNLNSIRYSCNSKKGYHRTKQYMFYYWDQTHGQDVEKWKNNKLRQLLRFHDGVCLERFNSISEATKKYGESVLNAIGSNTHYQYGDLWICEDEYMDLKDKLGLEEIEI